MRNAAFAACLIVLSSVVTAGNHLGVLDGTTWALTVEPDAMAQENGATPFRETLKFNDGKAALSDPKVGVLEAPYTVSRGGGTGWSFHTQRSSAAEGTSTWTGTVDGNSIEGKLVLIKSGGLVLIYTFKGYKLS